MSEPAQRYASFTAVGAPLAVPLAQLAGVVAPGPLQSLPHAAPWVLGVAAWRGRAVTVVDLAGLVGATPGSAAKWLLLQWQGQWLALAVSEVGAIVTAANSTEEAPSLPSELAALCAPQRLASGATQWYAELSVAALFAALAASSPFQRASHE